jgi:hypothetical protein
MFFLPTGHITVFAALADGRTYEPLIEESVFERDGFWTTLVGDIQMVHEPKRPWALIAILLYLIPDSRMTRPISIYCLRK